MKRLHKKMRLLSFFMAAGLVLSSVMLQVEAYIQKTGMVNETVSLRQNAEAASSQLMELTSGQEVKVNNELTDASGTIWYQVLIGTTVGYVPANTITVSEGSAETPASGDGSALEGGSSQATQTVTKTRRVGQVLSGNAVRVRPDASTNNAQVAILGDGEKFEVIEDVNGADGFVWYHITFVQEGVEIDGYVRSDLVNVTEETYEEQVPIEETVTVPSETEPQEPYSVISQTNAEGTNVWYLKNNTTGDVKDIASLLTPVTEEKTSGTSKALVVLLLIFFILALAAAAFFYMKWRDADEFIAELRDKRAQNRQKPAQTAQTARTAPVSPIVSGQKPAEGQKPVLDIPSRTAVKPAAPKTQASAPQQPARQAPVNTAAKQSAPKQTTQSAGRMANQQMGQKAVQPTEKDNLPKSSDIVKTTKKEIQNKEFAPTLNQSKSWKSKNFLTDDDDLEFDFLEMDDK